LTFLVNKDNTGPAVWRGRHVAYFEGRETASSTEAMRVGVASHPKFPEAEIGELFVNNPRT